MSVVRNTPRAAIAKPASPAQDQILNTSGPPTVEQKINIDDKQLSDLQARVAKSTLVDNPVSILQTSTSPVSPTKEQQSYAGLGAGGSNDSVPRPAGSVAGLTSQTVRFDEAQDSLKDVKAVGKDLPASPRMAFRLSGRKATPHPMIRRSMHDKETGIGDC